MLARAFEGWHIVVIALVVLILFGSKKLPDAARSFGRSLRILKAETKGLRDDDGVDRNIDDRHVADRDVDAGYRDRPPAPQPSQHIALPLPQGSDTARARETYRRDPDAAETRRDELEHSCAADGAEPLSAPDYSRRPAGRPI